MKTQKTEETPQKEPKSPFPSKSPGAEKYYEKKKKEEHEELWKKVNENPELMEIVKLKNKLEHAKLDRTKTTNKISEMKTSYDTMKKDIQSFIREQSSAFHKLNFPKKTSPTLLDNNNNKFGRKKN
jgi:hypothetical protein